ncbi:MAG: hypothetical protein ACP5D1_11510 [Bacteroidales bacterium]
MKKNYWIMISLVLVLLFLSACTAGPNTVKGTPSPSDQEVAGFLMGLWHGIISPVTFVISLFTDKISLYEVHNNGGWYDFGFVLGAGILFGGGSRASRR